MGKRHSHWTVRNSVHQLTARLNQRQRAGVVTRLTFLTALFDGESDFPVPWEMRTSKIKKKKKKFKSIVFARKGKEFDRLGSAPRSCGTDLRDLRDFRDFLFDFRDFRWRAVANVAVFRTRTDHTSYRHV